MFNVINHDYETRFSNQLSYGNSNNNFGLNRISIIGPRLYNHLPTKMKNIDDKSFKMKL